MTQIISCTDSNITWVGRWADETVTGNDVKTILSCGNHFRFKFSGTSLALNCVLPSVAYLPYIEYSIDGGVFTRQQVTTAATTLATGLASGLHTAEIWVSGVQEDLNRWFTHQGLTVQSIGLDDGGYLAPWNPSRRKMLVLGDSIAEAEFSLGVQLAPPGYTTPIFTSQTTSGRSSFIVQICRALDIDCWNHSWSGSGLSMESVGHTPPTATNYLYKMDGIAADDPAFDMVYIEVVNNDYSLTSEAFAIQYRALIDTIRSDHPQAVIFCMGPMGPYALDKTIVVPQVAMAKGCIYIDTGRVPQDPDIYEEEWADTWGIPFDNYGHPDVAGHTAIAALVQPTVAAYLSSVFGSANATGSELTAQTGTATATGSGNVAAVGAQATAEIGQAQGSPTSNNTVQAVGAQGITEAGTGTASGTANVAATGAQATCEAGTATATATGTAAATGAEPTAETGAATARGDGYALALLSVELTAEYGIATASATSAPSTLTGVFLRDSQGRMFGLRDNQGRTFALRQI